MRCELDCKPAKVRARSLAEPGPDLVPAPVWIGGRRSYAGGFTQQQPPGKGAAARRDYNAPIVYTMSRQNCRKMAP